MGARRPPLPTAVVCPQGRRRRLRLAITANGTSGTREEPGTLTHRKLRNQCKDCGGASICEHNRRRSVCKDCGGTSICEHNRVRSKCVDCGGDSICAHLSQEPMQELQAYARLSLPPPAGSCDRMLGVHAHAPHDPSRTSARGSCGRHRRSPLRPRSHR